MLRAVYLALVVLPLVLLQGAGVAVRAAESDSVKVLLIGKEPDHPYGSHMYMHTCFLLAECLKENEGMEAVVSKGWPTDRKTLEEVRTLVVYTSPAAELLLDAPHRGELEELMNQGVGLVTIHWASTVRQENLERLGPAWISYLGGTWVSNVGLSGGKSVLRQLEPEHPVFRGWEEYEIEDEYYLNPVIGEQATPLLEVQERNGQKVIVGWAYERPDGGRSFATTLGHPYSNFQIPAFRRMLVNAIFWTAGREVPEQGAVVGVSQRVLDLPPEE